MAGHETGRLVTIDSGVLAAITDLASAGAGAVERLNNRINGWVTERGCIAAQFATGATSAACSADPAR